MLSGQRRRAVSFSNRRYSLEEHLGQMWRMVWSAGQERVLCSMAEGRSISSWQLVHFIQAAGVGVMSVRACGGRLVVALSDNEEDGSGDAQVGENEGDGGEGF